MSATYGNSQFAKNIAIWKFLLNAALPAPFICL